MKQDIDPIMLFDLRIGGAAVARALARAAGAGVHLLVLFALELLVEHAGWRKKALVQKLWSRRERGLGHVLSTS